MEQVTIRKWTTCVWLNSNRNFYKQKRSYKIKLFFFSEFHKKTLWQSEPEVGPSQMHNLIELVKKEQNIYDTVFYEIIR